MPERAPKTAEELPDFAWQCIRYADAHGTVRSKRNDPFAASLAMELDEEDLHIEFTVFQSPHSNGSLHVKVIAGDMTVLEAKGKYIGKPFDIAVETYAPGAWEDRIIV